MPRKKNIPAGSEYFKDQYQQQIARGETEKQLERQKARRSYDKAGIDRTGRDIDHKQALAEGGKTEAGNLRLRGKTANRADNGHKKGEKAGKKRSTLV